MTKAALKRDSSRTLNAEEMAAFGAELDALRDAVIRDLGAKDLAHLRRIQAAERRLEAAGRLLLHFGLGPLSFLGGVGMLAAAKILDNMEIGHNVMHGQYDWTKEPDLAGNRFEWDNVCAGEDWRHSHNFEHHTFTNIVGKDRDVGYALLRVTPEQPWNLSHLVQPISAVGLAFVFQWGVAIHDLRLDETLEGRQSWREHFARAKPFLRKAAGRLAKDYLFFPALALGNAPRVLLGNLLANVVRNLWTFAVIFCGHFPEGVQMYPEPSEPESRGAWYLRQLNGSANLEGGALFHVMTGHLSHQIEHHLFPDLPAARYPELAPKVRELCTRYRQVYHTGSLPRQLASVFGKIVKYALPTSPVVGPPADSRVDADGGVTI